jgi:hypothetical protein
MTEAATTAVPSLRRIAAGKQNVLKRKKFTAEGLARLRAVALANQPWRFSTGPRTVEGKRRSAANGRARQKGSQSVRQLRAERADYLGLIRTMAAGRHDLAERLSPHS